MKSLEIENGISHIYNNDKKLAGIIDQVGRCTLRPKRDHYLSLLGSIISQQLSVRVADIIEERFIKYFDGNPTPEKIIVADTENLRGLGMSYSKVKYVKDLSEKIVSKEIHFKNLNKLTDEQIISEYTKVKGIGVWTVHMFLIFTLARLNILPVGDLGIKRAAMIIYNLRKLPDENKMILISKKNNWAPYNSIASWYLWRSLELNNLKPKNLKPNNKKQNTNIK